MREGLGHFAGGESRRPLRSLARCSTRTRAPSRFPRTVFSSRTSEDLKLRIYLTRKLRNTRLKCAHFCGTELYSGVRNTFISFRCSERHTSRAAHGSVFVSQFRSWVTLTSTKDLAPSLSKNNSTYHYTNVVV